MVKIAFDIQKAIVAAWEMLWAQNLESRKEDESYAKKVGKKPFNWARSYYLCAADIVQTVRGFAQQTADGKEWALNGYNYGIKMRGDLQNMVRNWLFAQASAGKLAYHNFGRGHISGARFRPAGEPMAPAEVKTMVDKEKRRSKPTIRHYAKGYGGLLLCMTGRKRSSYRHRPSRSFTTSEAAKVTCPRCLKALKNVPVEAKASAEPDVVAVM